MLVICRVDDITTRLLAWLPRPLSWVIDGGGLSIFSNWPKTCLVTIPWPKTCKFLNKIGHFCATVALRRPQALANARGVHLRTDRWNIAREPLSWHQFHRPELGLRAGAGYHPGLAWKRYSRQTPLRDVAPALNGRVSLAGVRPCRTGAAGFMVARATFRGKPRQNGRAYGRQCLRSAICATRSKGPAVPRGRDTERFRALS
jgi:hypothetical protein